MSGNLKAKYPHLKYERHWKLTKESWFLLGQCEVYVKAISNTPILPEHHRKLLNVSLIKGAQATTAIEGNTLSQEEIEQIQKGKHMPPSKEYQEIEVRNILNAFNTLLEEVVFEDKAHTISPDLIKRFHKIVGKGLGEHFDAIPGQFRTDNRIVGKYLCPDYQYVPELVQSFCDWLVKEFHYNEGQNFYEVVIQAIVSHVYLEWIHPFGDGNGRTGRLLEFYILLRGGNPDIASHILSNHYNETRTAYYRQLENATKRRDLTDFIQYALLGLRDGLASTLNVIQRSLFEISWQKLIYDRFAAKTYRKRDVFKRQRELILSYPTDKGLSLNEIVLLTPSLARKYAKLSERTVKRDIDELVNMNLLLMKNRKYIANDQLVRGYFAKTKS